MRQQNHGMYSEPFNRRLYPNPSAANLSYPRTSVNDPHNQYVFDNHADSKTFARVRKTDHTDDQVSDRSPSRSRALSGQNPGVDSLSAGEGASNKASRLADSQASIIRVLSKQQERFIELREKLRNIHHFYRIRIEEQRNKNLERNEIFIGVIEDLQRSHNQKLASFQQSLELLEDEKEEINEADSRIQNIKITIQDILGQSRNLKQANQQIEKQLNTKAAVLQQKEQEYVRLKSEVDSYRRQAEEFERLKLKEFKRNQQLLEIMEGAGNHT